MNGMPVPPGLWQEARNSDGRVYYYNVQTKATQWIKPLELMTPVEVCILCLCIYIYILLKYRFLANAGRSTMERIHCGGWTKVLVQHRNQGEFVGDARCLQKCSRAEPAAPETGSCVSFARVFTSC